MKEYDEDEAAALMCAATGNKCSHDDAIELIDIIYDFYDENGDLDIDFDDDDCDADIDEIVAYIRKALRKNPLSTQLSDDELRAAAAAEIEYENSII